MKRKLSKKGQLLVIGVLSLLVLCCLFGEAWNRGIFEEEAKEQQDTRKEKKDTESETEEAVQQRVKVLLMTEGFASLFHQTVRITSSEPFTVTENGAEKTYAAGEVFECDGDTYAAGQKLVCKPQKGAKLKILSFQRQNRYPSYRGNLRLTWKKKGILITNQISLEEYLYAVVPSELSTSNKMEALKAQAVCARSYAYQQIRAAKYKKYHAHMDDSAAFQVYNNVPEDKRSRKAVDATKGMVLTSDGSVVQAYYYSTSWGYSASGQDVWNTGSPIAYLKNKLQVRETEKNKTYDLSSEEAFRDFIDNSSVDTYDSKASWYRWKVTISGESLSARIDAALASCYASNPELVLTQNASGQYEQKPLKSLGTLKKIRVEERKKSGLVTEIVLVGKKMS